MDDAQYWEALKRVKPDEVLQMLIGLGLVRMYANAHGEYVDVTALVEMIERGYHGTT